MQNVEWSSLNSKLLYLFSTFFACIKINLTENNEWYLIFVTLLRQMIYLFEIRNDFLKEDVGTYSI